MINLEPVWRRLYWRFHAWVAFLTLRMIEMKLGREWSEHWYWEMTPMPAGYPSLRQYGIAVRMMIGGMSVAAKLAHEEDQRFEEECRRFRDAQDLEGSGVLADVRDYDDQG